MAAVKKTTRQNGYGEKIAVKVITVDKERRRVECATRDGAMIWAAVWETPTVFRWPEVGETWTVRKDTGIWRLDQIVQTELGEEESEVVPKTLEELPEGDTRILGNTVWVQNIHVIGESKNDFRESSTGFSIFNPTKGEWEPRPFAFGRVIYVSPVTGAPDPPDAKEFDEKIEPRE